MSSSRRYIVDKHTGRQVLVLLRRIPDTRKVRQAIETTFNARMLLELSSYHYCSRAFSVLLKSPLYNGSSADKKIPRLNFKYILIACALLSRYLATAILL